MKTYNLGPNTKQEIMFSDWSDEQMATSVRMCGRNDIDHEAIVTGARDRILHLSQRQARLIELLQATIAGIRAKSRDGHPAIKPAEDLLKEIDEEGIDRDRGAFDTYRNAIQIIEGSIRR